MRIVYSNNNVPIRLTDERWLHIVENHDELAGLLVDVLETIADPDIIVQGSRDEYLAIRKRSIKWLVVVYKEPSKTDGFVITAFITSRIGYFIRKDIIWKKQ